MSGYQRPRYAAPDYAARPGINPRALAFGVVGGVLLWLSGILAGWWLAGVLA